jgi:hypothetical protein
VRVYIAVMPTANGTKILDQLLEPVSRCLTPEVARALSNLRASAKAQARIEELADRCVEGKLTSEEEAEYDAYLWGGNLIAILQAKARALLAKQAKA